MQFSNPYFLFGLFAIAIPIAIHLFNFRRFKKVYFSNVDFLKEVAILTKKQKKIKQRILLFTRILSIILLVLLFSKPYIPSKEENLVGYGGNAVVICVDNSFSMQNQGREGRLLDEAKQKAKDIINEYNADDQFLLLTMDLEGRHQQFVNRERFVQLLDEVEISPKSIYYSKLLTKASDLLNTKYGYNKRVFFVSDFQAPSFDIEKFPKDSAIRTLLVPLNANNISNLYVDSISFDSPIMQVGKNIMINVRVVNSSEKSVEGVSVKLFIDNRQVAVSSLDMDKNQSKSIEMSFTLQKYGTQQARVSIIDNPINFDDDFFFSIEANPKIEILSINSNSPNPYIARLFSLNQETSITNMSEKAIDYGSFNNYSLIILNELNEFSSGLASELLRYRERGGDIIIIPSKSINLSSYTSSMQMLSLPYYSQLIEMGNRVSIIDESNILYKGVFSQRTDNMEMPKVSKYFKLSYSTQTARESIMSFQSQDDFLLVSQKDKSKVYIFAINLTDDFTDFTKQALFVPTLWNMALFSQIIPQSYYFLTETKPIDISYIKNIDKLKLPQIVSLDNKEFFIPEFRKENQYQSLNIHNQIKKAGNYNIEQEGLIYGGLSFNYSRMESRLNFLDSKDILLNLRKNFLNSYSVLSSKSLMISSYFKNLRNQVPFTIILVFLLLVSLGVETFILLRNK